MIIIDVEKETGWTNFRARCESCGWKNADPIFMVSDAAMNAGPGSAELFTKWAEGAAWERASNHHRCEVQP